VLEAYEKRLSWQHCVGKEHLKIVTTLYVIFSINSTLVWNSVFFFFLETDQNAERALREFEERNLPEFVVSLARELATEGKDLRARQLAGLHFKNFLVAKDDTLQAAKHNAWKSLAPEVRQNVKASLLTALRSPETIARHTAAQAASEVAAIELPYNEWNDFLPTLLENVKSQPEGVTIASLECLGFSCERISALDGLPPIDEKTTDAMLTTIVDGIQKTRPEPIRLAASIALRHSLVFADKNMERKPERDAIMNNICEATQSTDPRVRSVAFECITQIADHYYDKLGDYMTAIFQLTMDAIRRDEEDVAKQAIEFWSTLCEVEVEMLDDAEDWATRDLPVERPCVRYVAAAVEHLGPVLLEALAKQDEDADTEDEHYNVSMASAMCLSLVAQTVEDLVVPVVLPFVTANIKNENWRLREAATMAFASILDGTSADAIGGVVNQSIPVLLNALSDSHVMVRDTSAYAIGRICDLHIRSIPVETLPLLVDGLMSKLLTESTRVSAQACSALHNLASAFAEDDSSLSTGTNALSQYIPALLETLLKTADREDADDHNLRVAAIEALSVLVQYSAPDVQPVLLQLLPVVVQRLHVSFSIQAVTQEDRDRKEGLQGLWCALIQVLCQKMTKEEFAPQADAVMSNLLTVLQSKNATSHSDAFTAISAVADNMEGDFEVRSLVDLRMYFAGENVFRKCFR
jgi:importin subunit beta-1